MRRRVFVYVSSVRGARFRGFARAIGEFMADSRVSRQTRRGTQFAEALKFFRDAASLWES